MNQCLTYQPIFKQSILSKRLKGDDILCHKMPRKATDYEKALIYKICCLDPDVKEIYVGSTTDIIRRRYNHKLCCTNPNSKNYNLKVYKHIRQHGGWDNWKMILIEYFPCKTELELGKNEDHWKQELQASLNCITPPMYATKKEYCVANRQQINDRQRAYNEAHPEYHAEYYVANRQQRIDRANEYYVANREQVAEKKGQKITCECGCVLSRGNIATHKKSNKHQKYLQENTNK